MNMQFKYYMILPLITLLSSCGKEFLEAKPNQSLVVPHTVKDLQALLDNTAIMNNNTPHLAEASAGDNGLLPNRFQNVQVVERNAFIWAKEINEGQLVSDWDWSYRRLFHANLALEGLEKVPEEDKAGNEYKLAKGSAHFFRAWTFYHLAQEFCKPYIRQTAQTDAGIPLRVESDINIKTTRASVQQTYDQIIRDGREALNYLPPTVLSKTRPSRQAAYALLANTFLQMQDYEKALLYADSCLKIRADLIDYNTVSPTATFSFKQFNPEVIFHSYMLHGYTFNDAYMDVNRELYQQYGENDLRKALYFRDNKGALNTKGSYSGARELFSGYAIDEIYLILAECYARKPDKGEAVKYLNTLLKNRWKTGTFVPVAASNDEDVLRRVLAERRTELAFRGHRWSDLRRLNQDSRFAVTLSRTVGTTVYTLPPNDQRYVLPIPDYVIDMTGIAQNPR